MVKTITNRTQGRILDMQSKDLSELQNLDFKSSYNFISKVDSDISIDFTDNYSLADIFYTSGIQLKSINRFISLYCFRHAIELYIKFCLSCYAEELEQSRIMYSHDLRSLYKKFSELTKGDLLKEKVLELEPVISKLGSKESKENSYRYGNMSHNINRYIFDLDKLGNFVYNLRILCGFWYKCAGGNLELMQSKFVMNFEDLMHNLVKLLEGYNDN